MVTRHYNQRSLIAEFPFSALTANTVLRNPEGNSSFDLDVIDWREVSIELEITSFAGSSTPTVKVAAYTHNRNNGSALELTDTAVVQGDGSTAFETATLNAAGRRMVSLNAKAASGATSSNLGRNIGLVLIEGGTVTDATGVARLYVKGR